MDKHIEANRKLWDTMTPIHERSEMYDVEGWKAGKCSLAPLEVEEVGDVSGKALLHLQCHFGLDTLSWARRGAEATGVDFSSEAIFSAKKLSAESGVKADFICSDIYALGEKLDGQFDVVFTSQGVLCWLPDIPRWGAIVSQFLKPGGVFYIYEFHPFAYVFDDDPDVKEPRVRYPYFDTGEATRFEQTTTYASGESFEPRVNYEWPYAISDVVNSLIAEGLAIEFLHEFDRSTYKSHEFLAKCDDGFWRKKDKPDLPLMFSLRAVKG